MNEGYSGRSCGRCGTALAPEALTCTACDPMPIAAHPEYQATPTFLEQHRPMDQAIAPQQQYPTSTWDVAPQQALPGQQHPSATFDAMPPQPPYQHYPPYGTGPSPSPAWLPYVPATFGQRFAARIIDGLVVSVPTVVLWIALFGSISAFSKNSTGGALAGLILGPLLVLGVDAVASLVYWQICEALSGRTVGRAAMGIRLVRLRPDLGFEPRVGHWLSFGRRFVSGLGDLLIGAGSWTMLSHPERKTWGDRATGTAVVQSRDGRGPTRGVLCSGLVTALGVVAIVALVASQPNDSQLPGTGYEAQPFDGGLPSAAPTYVASTGTDLTGNYGMTFTFTEATASGTPATATLEVGTPQHYETGAVNGKATLGSACSGDASADAMIPYKLTLTNDGTSSADVAVVFDGLGSSSIPGINGPTLSEEASYSAGPACGGQDGGNNFGAQSTALAGGSSSSTYGFFIVQGAYGGAATFDAIMNDTRLTVSTTQSASDTGSVLQVKDAAGPGVTRSAYGGWLFVLSGSTVTP